MVVRTTRADASARSSATAGEGPAGEPSTDRVAALRHEMDRLIEEFYRQVGLPFAWRGVGFNPFGRLEMEFAGAKEVLPRADLVETPTEYRLTVEIPGVSDDSIEVGIIDDELAVSGIKARAADDDEMARHLSERRYGKFQRTIRIPDSVDVDGIAAALERGVLVVTLPKRPDTPVRSKKVEVSRG
jgi:HSP20 family protein